MIIDCKDTTFFLIPQEKKAIALIGIIQTKIFHQQKRFV